MNSGNGVKNVHHDNATRRNNKLAKATIPFVTLPRNIDPLSICAKVVTNVIGTAVKYDFCQMTVADVKVCLDAAVTLLQIFV